MDELTKELLELAIKRKELDLFFGQKGMYSLSENAHWLQGIYDIFPDIALTAIYKYYEETKNKKIMDLLIYTIYDMFSYKNEIGKLRALYILETIRRFQNEGQATFILCECRCGHRWFIDDSSIPDNERYEVVCSKCGMLLKKKKVKP